MEDKYLLFKAVDNKEFENLEIRERQLIINYENCKLYFDIKGTRHIIGDIDVDTIMSKDSDNPIANKAVTNSIINDLETVMAVNVDNVICGTKPLKNLAERVAILEEIVSNLQ